VCGIAGAVAAAGADLPPRGGLESAVRALRHRGPDGHGVDLPGASVALGHTRLAIVDIERGAQPMPNEDGTVVVVFNGEIWNYKALRRELERSEHRFRSAADTEVLVHGYEEWGDELLAHVDGMFAFALWDANRERVLLARDRLGKKPLYYAVSEAGLAFGSDARSVHLVTGRRPVLDEAQVAEFLFQRYVCSPRTLFAGVQKLPPGHLLHYDRKTAVVRPYWSLSTSHVDEPLDAGSLRTLLQEAVERRLMGDVPVGMLLSGGIDSAAVLGLMHEAGATGVPTFTIGFDDRLYDERPGARLAAERYGTDHHELVVGSGDFIDVLPRLAWYRDEPMAEPTEAVLLLLAELAGAHVKVVLSGDGGDELFGGYPKYRAERLLGNRLVPPAGVALAVRLLARRPTHRRLDRAAASMRISDEVTRWASWFRSFGPAELDRLLAPGLRGSAAPERLTAPLRSLLEPYAGVDRGRRQLIGDLLTYLPENMLARSDKVLMAASVEGRMPLLDRQVVERVALAPARDRADLRRGKAVLRAAIADLVPAETLTAPKRGFPVPIGQFLVEGAGRLVESVLLSERTADRGLFEPGALRALVADAGGDADRSLKLFTLASLELWCRANIDALTEAPPAGFEELLEAEEALAVA
jgi:asparagine synthase (glutamine-hydrolysing)